MDGVGAGPIAFPGVLALAELGAATTWQNPRGMEVEPSNEAQDNSMATQLAIPEQEQAHVELDRLRVRTEILIQRIGRALAEGVEQCAGDDDDAADQAGEVFARSQFVSMVQRLEKKLVEIDRARELARQGRYGLCQRCGTQIPPERLEILPETTVCVVCAGHLEQTARRHHTVLDHIARESPLLYGDSQPADWR